MPDKPETQAPVIISKPAAGTARTVWRSLFLVAVGGIGGVLGFVTGSDYGDVFAPTFRFVGLEGHVATRTLGALTCAVVAASLTFLALLAFRRRPRAFLLAAIGIVIGLLLTEPLLFAALPPHHGLLPLAYGAAGLVGGAAGASLGAFSSRRRAAPPE